jgi:hypothetical protein
MSHTGERALDPLRLLIPEPAESGAYVVHDPAGDVDVTYTRNGDRLDVAATGASGDVSVEVPGRSAREEQRSSASGPDGRPRTNITLQI